MNKDASGVESYEEVPYEGRSIPHTHPCHLAMVARLCGYEPLPPVRCRVLELGCAIGTNLLPMAEALRDSQFVGVDASRGQIGRAQAMAESAGVGNVELIHADILDLDEQLGRFDYVVCHGVYSWVAPQVQRRIIELGVRLLAPNGLMLVSYNTFPGWHLRGAVRRMMLWHVAGLPSAGEKIAQARGLLEFLAGSARPLRPSWGALLQEEVEAVRSGSDHYLFHEQLEGYNEPLYFHEFVTRAEAGGLAYLADADITTMFAQHFDDRAAQLLLQAPLVRREQYMDFLRGRVFRSSLLRRPQWAPARPMGPECLGPLHLRMSLPLEVAQRADGVTTWTHADRKLAISGEMDLALARLREQWPAWVAVRDLLGTASAATAAEPLFSGLFALLSRGLVVAAETPPPVAAHAGSKPRSRPLARAQAGEGEWVTNLHHESVRLDAVARFVLRQLDGSVGLAELAGMLGRAFLQGDLQPGGATAAADRLDSGRHRAIVERTLRQLAGASLLLG
jgi:SAM-dependent methyltransferase